MAKTKKQAVAATAASARRSEAVNAGGCSRVGNSTDIVENGDEGNSDQGSERARRAARREEAGRQAAAGIDDKRDGRRAEDARGAEVESAADGTANSTFAAGVESDNYFTALAEEVTEEGTGQQPEGAEATRTEAAAVDI